MLVFLRPAAAPRSIPMGGNCPDTIGREISPSGSMSNETRCGASLNEAESRRREIGESGVPAFVGSGKVAL